MMYQQRKELVTPIEDRLYKIVEEKFGKGFRETW
jgi:hypothetical protein